MIAFLKFYGLIIVFEIIHVLTQVVFKYTMVSNPGEMYIPGLGAQIVLAALAGLAAWYVTHPKQEQTQK